MFSLKQVLLFVGTFGLCWGQWTFKCPLFDPDQDCQIDGDQRFAQRFGANLANLDEWPYLVSLQRPFISCYVHFCEGVLIAPNLVLTAAHCVDSYRQYAERDFPDGEIYVTKSSKCSQQEGSGGRIQPKQIIMHPSWNTLEFRNDIAVIVLRDDLSDDYADYRESRFPRVYSRQFLQDVYVAGFRLSGGPTPTQEMNEQQYRKEFVVPLLSATLSLIPESSCKTFIGEFYDSKVGADALNYDTMICGFNSGSDTCQGDSGAPLIYREKNKRDLVIGVASWGPQRQCNPEKTIESPAVFTRVGEYVDWIDQIYIDFASGDLPPELEKQESLIFENSTLLNCEDRFIRKCSLSLKRSCCENLEDVRINDRCFDRLNEYVYSGVCESTAEVVLAGTKAIIKDCKCS